MHYKKIYKLVLIFDANTNCRDNTHFVFAFLMSWRLSEKKKMVPKNCITVRARTTQVCLFGQYFLQCSLFEILLKR